MNQLLLETSAQVELDYAAVRDLDMDAIAAGMLLRRNIQQDGAYIWLRRYLTSDYMEIRKRNELLRALSHEEDSLSILENAYDAGEKIKHYLEQIKMRSGRLAQCTFSLNIVRLFVESVGELHRLFAKQNVNEIASLRSAMESFINSEAYRNVEQVNDT